MEKITMACVILHNIIIDDKWEDLELNQKYLKEKDGSNFKVIK